MSDSATVRGVVHFIDETKSYGQKGFRKRTVVLEQPNDRFTNYIPVEFTRDDCESVDELKVGDDVEITYFLTGRKWQRDERSEVKYFLNAEATSFRVVGAGGGGDSSNSGASVDDVNAQLADAAEDGDDDNVPF